MASPQEIQVVEWVADFVELDLGVIPGPWTEGNRMGGSDLSVDFTFEAADPPPPFAVEVTALRDDFERNWTDAFVAKVEDRIRKFAKARGWPGGVVALHQEVSFDDDLAPAIEATVDWMDATGVDRIRPATWSAGLPGDLIQRILKAKGHDASKEFSDARLRGVNEIQRLPSGDVLVIWVHEGSDHRSSQRPLVRAFAKKGSGSLRVAKDRGYVTILAVDVEREDTRTYLGAGVRVPDPGQKIDHLFMFVRKAPGGDLDAAFYANGTARAAL